MAVAKRFASPAMSAKRGNPNWYKPWPAQLGPPIATEFETNDTELPQLTPVAEYEGSIAASNLLSGNRTKIGRIAVPTVVYTVPPLATVGLSEDAARAQGQHFRVHSEKTGDWYSSRRVAEDCSGFKVLIEEGSGRVLGANVLGPTADELINLFALAMQSGMKAEALKEAIFAYPTHGSDVAYML